MDVGLMKGYDAYAQKAEIARKGGLEGAVKGFMKPPFGGPRTASCANWRRGAA